MKMILLKSNNHPNPRRRSTSQRLLWTGAVVGAISVANVSAEQTVQTKAQSEDSASEIVVTIEKTETLERDGERPEPARRERVPEARGDRGPGDEGDRRQEARGERPDRERDPEARGPRREGNQAPEARERREPRPEGARGPREASRPEADREREGRRGPVDGRFGPPPEIRERMAEVREKLQELRESGNSEEARRLLENLRGRIGAMRGERMDDRQPEGRIERPSGPRGPQGPGMRPGDQDQRPGVGPQGPRGPGFGRRGMGQPENGQAPGFQGRPFGGFRPGGAFPAPMSFEGPDSRVMHLRQAIQHLRAAGLHEVAERVEQEAREHTNPNQGPNVNEVAERMERELNEVREHVEHMINEMREHAHREMEETHRAIEELHGKIGHVAEFTEEIGHRVQEIVERAHENHDDHEHEAHEREHDEDRERERPDRF